MKTKEAIETLKQGKRIVSISSDPPVNLCDHLEDNPVRRGFHQLCHQDKVVHLVQVSSCAAEVKGLIWDLDMFEKIIQYPYLNFAVCE